MKHDSQSIELLLWDDIIEHVKRGNKTNKQRHGADREEHKYQLGLFFPDLLSFTPTDQYPSWSKDREEM